MERLGKPTSQQADAHYRAVIRALVAEALELSTFLEKVSQGTNDLRTKTETTSTELDQLQFSDWVSNLTTVTEGRQKKKPFPFHRSASDTYQNKQNDAIETVLEGHGFRRARAVIRFLFLFFDDVQAQNFTF